MENLMKSQPFKDWKEGYAEQDPEGFAMFNDKYLFEIYLTSQRIQLIEMPNDPNPIPVGTKGTIHRVEINSMTASVNWDNGRTLGLDLNVDKFKIIRKTKEDIRKQYSGLK